MVIEVLFWLLLLLCALECFAPESPAWIGKSRWVVVLILIAILGLMVFHNPVTGQSGRRAEGWPALAGRGQPER